MIDRDYLNQLYNNYKIFLTKNQRKIYEMRFIKNFTATSTANQLGKSIPTISQTTKRVDEKLLKLEKSLHLNDLKKESKK